MPSPALLCHRLVSGVSAALLTGLVLTGCASTAAPDVSSSAVESADGSALLAEFGLDGLDAPAVIERLDTLPVDERPADLLASVQPDALLLSDDQGREAQLPMPEGDVYLSIAPFRTQTHDCHFHSLTTCVGELGGEEIDVTLTGADGDVIIEESLQTYDNGFVGLWVPRGIAGELTIAQRGRSGTVPVSTEHADDPTCITTLQLP